MRRGQHQAAEWRRRLGLIIMINSHAKAHFMRTSAAAIGLAEASPDPVRANAYELMLAKLAQDKRRLHDLQSIERRAEVKTQLLPDYQPWIDGVLEGESGQQDDVLMTVFVWAIDIGNFATALKIGAYAIEHNLVMPDQYKRDVPCVLAEEIADQSLKALAVEQPADLSAIEQTMQLTDGRDMPDQVRAKLQKALGYAQRAAGNLVAARDALTRALELHDKVGVKKDIERLDTLIKNSAEAPEETAQPAAETGSPG
ncbi:phage terminase small subunit [Dechloromonas denitrificans]|uniref:phage terminase small subunit n=1 Tax=Dechloromonas denitrificans TaxID=281362 RepID=UPI001CF8F99C|nr:phage terminase small subunit [Dechloromonas denitrificans]UCV02285.1 hypothetical protein KI611_14460 [Dechloromonas denitrificans]